MSFCTFEYLVLGSELHELAFCVLIGNDVRRQKGDPEVCLDVAFECGDRIGVQAGFELNAIRIFRQLHRVAQAETSGRSMPVAALF